MKRFVLSTFLVSFGALSGCAGLNSQFDCPIEPRVMCKSLDEVNTMIDQGKLGRLDVDAHEPTANYPDRSRVMRIWIAPYEEAGHDYPSTTVYRVIKPNWTPPNDKGVIS